MAMLIRREIDPFRLVDAFFGGDALAPVAPQSAPRTFAPRFDVRETKEAYVFKADVPGVAEKDLDVQLKANVLTISGERKADADGAANGERYFAAERTYGKFSRAFSLPDGIDAEHVTADVKEGVLTLVVPKRAEAQPRRIAIGSPAGSAKA
jgi:HSP20 family protein